MRLVLDTNVAIDWLVFNDPFLADFRARASRGDVLVLTNALATAEFQRVLAYPELKLDPPRRADAFDRYVQQATIVTMPESFARENLLLPPLFPHCRDRDDDEFLALALHSQADALVTRDKRLLKLRKRVRKFSMQIWTVPEMAERVR